MKKVFITAALPFLLAGTTGRTQKIDLPAVPVDSITIDTAMAKRIAERMATEWAHEKTRQIDTILRKDIVGRIDIDQRPDGSVYAWIWKYQVIGRDTIYDTTIVKQIR